MSYVSTERKKKTNIDCVKKNAYKTLRFEHFSPALNKRIRLSCLFPLYLKIKSKLFISNVLEDTHSFENYVKLCFEFCSHS